MIWTILLGIGFFVILVIVIVNVNEHWKMVEEGYKAIAREYRERTVYVRAHRRKKPRK